MFFYVGFGLGLAMMSDMIDERTMGLGVGIYQGAQWMGGISGILVTGMTLSPDTASWVFGVNGIVAVASVGLLMAVGALGARRKRPLERKTRIEIEGRMTRMSLPH
jgi:MFS family permease